MSRMKTIKGKRILIFGGTGSLGKVLIKKYVDSNVVCVFSRDESKHWTIRNEIDHANLSFVIGDVRDKKRCLEAILTFKPTHIILAAALKHVDVCEKSPMESIFTNIKGISNVVDSVKENLDRFDFLKTVLLVSTDKACSPINVYGMCKALAERTILSASQLNTKTKFIVVRYGNILESRGSIIPLFKYQSENCSSITITDDRMTRYAMTLNESVELIEAAILEAKNGETWVPKMPSMKIIDLAEIFSETFDKPIKSIGMRPGEKIHEDLINEAESARTRSAGKYLAVLPSSTTPFTGQQHKMDSSKSLLSKVQLKEYLSTLGILNRPLPSFVGKTIEEIRKI